MIQRPLYDVNKSDVLEVTFCVPSAEDYCHISMEFMKDTEIEVIPQIQFFPHQPDYRKALLPCGHSFGAMPLMFYWLRESMRCPVCRFGIDSKMCVTNMHPSYVSQLRDILDQAEELDEQDNIQEEQDRLNEMVLSEYQLFLDNPDALLDQVSQLEISASIYFYKCERMPGEQVPSREIPLRLSENSFVPVDNNDFMIDFYIQRNHVREICKTIRTYKPEFIQFTFHSAQSHMLVTYASTTRMSTETDFLAYDWSPDDVTIPIEDGRSFLKIERSKEFERQSASNKRNRKGNQNSLIGIKWQVRLRNVVEMVIQNQITNVFESEFQ